MIQNLADEQLLIKNEVSNVLFRLSKAMFENPIAIHDTLTATTIVCDELKNTANKKYFMETDLIEVKEEANTLVLNRLIVENIVDEQLLIRSEDKNVLLNLNNVTFQNPVAVQETLTATTIVYDELKNSLNKKYLTEIST